MRAAMWGKFGKLDEVFGPLAEEGADTLAGLDGGTGEKSVVTHAGKALG